MPSCAPRPVPTSRAVGRREPERAGARDDQDRDGGGHRSGGGESEEQPDGEGHERDGEDDRDEHARDAVGEPLHVCLAGLRRFDEPRHLRELCVVADPRRADDRAGRPR